MKEGFTLLELLIVIAILAVLTTIVILVVNPAEAIKKTRDTQRVSDLNNLKSTLLLYEVEEGELDLLEGECISTDPCKSTCHTDSTDSTYKCTGFGEGNTNKHSNNNATGWIPLDFTSMAGGSPISHLPTDPVNDDSYYYRFSIGSSFEIDCLFESEYYLTKQDLDKKDGGNCSTRYEIGTDLNILSDLGLIGWWKLDEDPAIHNTAISDSSEYQNNGILTTNDGDTNKSVTGKIGKAIKFDGIDDKVRTSLSHPTEAFSYSVWIKYPSGLSTNKPIISASYKRELRLLQSTNRLALITGASPHLYTAVGALTPDTWYHIVATHDSDTNVSTIYINGDYSCSGVRNLIATTNTVDIGYQSHASTVYNSTIDEVKIYNRVLSPEEIEAHYQAGL